mmetsp:Transcript_33203/g.30139  ORF Transcript_33203/g.30139 Transcript_33203/m.30139 type:complete len:89 (-) Transcript_33203:313-579(-)
MEYKNYMDSIDKSSSYGYRQEPSIEMSSVVSKNNFIFHYVVGKGGFGKVWKVESKKNKIYFAMKEMSKSKVINKRSVNSVMNERHLLS